MALTRFLQGDEQSTNTETIVASSLNREVKLTLPVVGDGTGATVDNNFLLVVCAQGGGSVNVVDNLGRRVWLVRPRTAVVLRSTDETSGSPRWNVERPALVEAAKITDLAATNLATTVAASGLALSTGDTYSETGIEAATAAALDAVIADAETKADAILTEVEDKVNLMIRALLLGAGQSVSSTPNAGATVAAAATPAPDLADVLANTDKLYTSARAFDVRVRLPVVLDGSGATVDDGHDFRFEANAAGGIIVEDNVGRFVGYVRPFSNAYAQATSDNSRVQYFWFPQDGFEIPLGRSATPGFLRVTRLSGQVVAAVFDMPAAYTNDATQNTAVDTGVDTVLASFDAKADAAFDEVDAAINAILLTLEGMDAMAES